MSDMYGESAVLVKVDATFDPVNGVESEQFWVGSPQAILTLATAYIAIGYKTNVVNHEGKSNLHVIVPSGLGVDPGAQEIPTDTFNIGTDMVEVSIWDSKVVTEKIALVSLTMGKDPRDMLSLAKTACQAALKGNKREGWAIETITTATQPDGLKDGDEVPEAVVDSETYKPVVKYYLVPAFRKLRDGPLTLTECNWFEQFSNNMPLAGFLTTVYPKLARGVESIQQEWPVLKWNRSYTVSYLARRQIPAEPPAYTTTALVSTFGIPNSIASILPEDPSWKPPNTQYAWRERSRDIQVDWRGRVSDASEFVFAAVDEDLYTIID